MIYVCFAVSPLHLICIKELANLHKNDTFVVYCFLYSRNNMVYDQIIKTIKLLNLDNVSEVLMPKNNIMGAFKRLAFAYSILNKYKSQRSTFVIFDFRNTFLHSLRRLFIDSRFILIDDGFATYESYHLFIKKSYYLPFSQYKGFQGNINKFIHFGLQYNYLLNKKIDIFTIYARELKLSKDSFNDLGFLREQLEGISPNYSDKLVFFAGSRFAEKDILTIEEEIAVIEKIYHYWLEKGKEMIYIGKRVEKGKISEKKIKSIEEKSIPVLFFDLPLELALIETKPQEMPTIICSFGSTLNKTLPMIYKEIDAYVVESDYITKKLSNCYTGNVKDSKIEVKKYFLQ